MRIPSGGCLCLQMMLKARTDLRNNCPDDEAIAKKEKYNTRSHEVVRSSNI